MSLFFYFYGGLAAMGTPTPYIGCSRVVSHYHGLMLKHSERNKSPTAPTVEPTTCTVCATRVKQVRTQHLAKYNTIARCVQEIS